MNAARRLVLVGYRGAGKTTVSRVVAARLQADFVDLDERIEATAGMTVREIFEQSGEAAFREMESAALQSVLADETRTTRSVLSVGGGAVLRAENRRLLREHCVCVWLEAPVDELTRRLERDGRSATLRPALTNLDPADEARRLLEQRAPLYAEVAQARVQTLGRTVEQVANEVLALISQMDMSA